ncbi:erythromycin esterase family protein [Micromonospora rifamycinica]|uniref:erythromycin esterase family protein n=1 Tax=Micromonospora rifamycinica TaxID=291594 RepID=UPI0034077035
MAALDVSWDALADENSASGARARPVSSDPEAPLDDLVDVLSQACGATVVGLGTSCRGANELWAHQHRALRHLVVYGGFRSLALEEDWTLCLQLDEYVRTGVGDIHELMATARSLWSTRELLHTLSWIRVWNEAHPHDLVHVFGLNADSTRTVAYEDVARYADAVAKPAQREHIVQVLKLLDPGSDIAAHIWRYRSLAPEGRAELLRAARGLHTMVAELGPHPLSAYALRQCDAITDFHEYHDRVPADVLAYAAPRIARDLVWWHKYTGHKIVYWGGIAHTVNASERALSKPMLLQRSTGSWLREHFADAYVSIGLTFGCGDVPQRIPPPLAGLLEASLETLSAAHSFALAGSCLGSRPAIVRIVGPDYSTENNPDCIASGGTLEEWFDLVIHTRRVTPAAPLRAEESPSSAARKNWRDLEEQR